MARRRSLTPEERELWRAVTRTATPLHAPTETKAEPEPNSVPAEKPRTRLNAKPRLSPFKIGEKHRKAERNEIEAQPGDALRQGPLRMDASTHSRMTRGKIAPEARIDLHGMTLAEAHHELISFILNARASGLRLVLIITGKGKRREDTGPIPFRVGVLRQQVPHWLHLPPLAPAVLQVEAAHFRHGGQGAYYVYLRRG